MKMDGLGRQSRRLPRCHRLPVSGWATDVVAVKHVAATARQGYEVDLAATNHLSVTDLTLDSLLLTSLLNGSVHHAAVEDSNLWATMEKLNATVVDFFNVFLKVDGTFSAAGSE